jgi:outer membrane protein
MKLKVFCNLWFVGLGILCIELVSTTTAQSQSIPLQNSNPVQKETLAGNLLILSGPLSLSEAVQIARKQNYSIKIAEQDLSITKAQVRNAESARLPLISLNAAGTLANEDFFYTTGVGPGNIPKNGVGELNIGVSLPLYTGGRLEARVEQTIAQRDATEADLATTRLESVFNVKQAYFQALFTQSQVVVYQEYVAQREASLKNTRELLAVGKVPRIYVLRDEAELSNAKQTLIAAQTEFGKTLAELKRVLGVNPTSDFTLSDTLKFKINTLELDKLLVLAKQNNPQLTALQLRVKGSKADISIANAAFAPQINLYAQGELRTPTSPGFGNGASLAVVATWLLADFDGRASEVDRVTANSRKAQLQVEEKEQELAKMITQSWLDLQAAKASIELTQSSVIQSIEENRLTQERFAVGRSIQLEVLNSSVALLRAQLGNIKAIYEYNITLSQLERLTAVEL